MKDRIERIAELRLRCKEQSGDFVNVETDSINAVLKALDEARADISRMNEAYRTTANHLLEVVLEVVRERDEAMKERDEALKQVSLKQQLEVAQAFHNVAVKERDAARMEVESLRNRLARFTAWATGEKGDPTL